MSQKRSIPEIWAGALNLRVTNACEGRVFALEFARGVEGFAVLRVNSWMGAAGAAHLAWVSHIGNVLSCIFLTLIMHTGHAYGIARLRFLPLEDSNNKVHFSAIQQIFTLDYLYSELLPVQRRI